VIPGQQFVPTRRPEPTLRTYQPPQQTWSPTQTPRTQPIPLCANGAADYTYPNCCLNGGQGQLCCTNGANNPDCSFPTTPPRTTPARWVPPTTTPSIFTNNQFDDFKCGIPEIQPPPAVGLVIKGGSAYRGQFPW
jgi:hypothetical protein